MESKPFKSRLFRRIISSDTFSYWDYLYAETLFRIKELEDLNCICGFCFRDKIHFRWILTQLENEGKIVKNKRAVVFNKIGECGRSLNDRPPAA